MASKKTRSKQNRRDRRKAKESGFRREGRSNPKKKAHGGSGQKTALVPTSRATRKRQASKPAPPKEQPPDDQNGQHELDTRKQPAVPDPPAPSAAIEQLRELVRVLERAIRNQVRINNDARAFVRSYIGWEWDMNERQRASINRTAEQIVKAIERDKEHDRMDVVLRVSGYVMASIRSRAPWDEIRKQTERRIKAIVEDLSIWTTWAEGVRGLGVVSVGRLIGEAGDFSTYANPAKLWKRFGAAVFDGEAQRRVKDADKAEMMGFNPRRRAVLAVIGDNMLRSGNETYKAVYDDRKEYELAREDDNKPKSKLHAHRRALRYMEKRLLRDMWRSWTRTQEKEGA